MKPDPQQPGDQDPHNERQLTMRISGHVDLGMFMSTPPLILAILHASRRGYLDDSGTCVDLLSTSVTNVTAQEDFRNIRRNLNLEEQGARLYND